MMRRIVGLGVLLGALAGCSGDEPMRVPPPPAGAGGLVVRWTIEDAEGEPLECADLQVVQMSVAIGGTPVLVACGDTQSVSFDGIIPGRLPLVIRLLNTVGIEVASHITNVEIVDQQTLEYEHTFVIDEVKFDSGTLDVNWTIDQRVAAQACSAVGAEQVRFASRAGSIAEIDMTVPCEDGRLIIRDARRGAYSFILWLVDADGNMLEPPETVTGIGVNAGDTTRISVSFNTMPREASRVLTTWTVTGTTASTTTCEDAGGVDVVVNLENRPQIGGDFTIIDTATATCDAGALRLMGPGARDYRIAARLYDTFGTPIDTVIVDDLDLRAGSATVAIEFLPPE